MKKVTFLAAIAFLGMSSLDASAQTTTPQEQAPAMQQEEKKEKVTTEQLPEPVQEALKSDTYKDWTVGDIYLIKPATEGTEGAIVYEVNLTNAQGQTGVVRMDERGGDASKKE
ncbi:hypothetical protein [Pontibacter pamirensis]|uniref:hypothetical protein n=1 Tax=Pontibacter pamirensis TaxID=2562824 RepID=UPI0013898D75|nr:hypothetical protein [Pontibacter pamirensis]